VLVLLVCLILIASRLLANLIRTLFEFMDGRSGPNQPSYLLIVEESRSLLTCSLLWSLCGCIESNQIELNQTAWHLMTY